MYMNALLEMPLLLSLKKNCSFIAQETRMCPSVRPIRVEVLEHV